MTPAITAKFGPGMRVRQMMTDLEDGLFSMSKAARKSGNGWKERRNEAS